MAKQNLYDAPGVNFTPGVFQGAGYEFQGPDVAIAERSLANLESRMNKANEAYSNMIVDLGKLKSQMHQDEVTQNWLKQYEIEKSKPINQLIEEGNFGRALRETQQIVANVLNDNDIQNRIRDNEKLNTQKEILSKELASGKINKMAYNYLIWKNEDEYANRFDATGEYKDDYKNDEVFYTQSINSIDFDKEIQTSFELISPKFESYSGSARVIQHDENGNPIETVKDKGSYSYKQVTEDQIINNLKERFADVGMYESLLQEYESKKHYYEELDRKINTTNDPQEKALLQEQYNKYSNELTNNGSYVSIDEYLSKAINRNLQIIKNRAYYDRTDNNVYEEAPVGKYDNGNGSTVNPLIYPLSTATNPGGVAQVKVDLSDSDGNYRAISNDVITSFNNRGTVKVDSASYNNNKPKTPIARKINK